LTENVPLIRPRRRAEDTQSASAADGETFGLQMPPPAAILARPSRLSGGSRLKPATANGPRRPPKRLGRPTEAAASRGNVVLFCGGGNHFVSRGLPGGAEGIQTDGHRGQALRSEGALTCSRTPQTSASYAADEMSVLRPRSQPARFTCSAVATRTHSHERTALRSPQLRSGRP
jgi:hypothetical protein